MNIRSSSCRRWSIAFLVASCIPIAIAKAENTTVLGATGGNIETIVFDPMDATGNTVYAGGQGGGVAKSVDGGDTWTSLFYHPIGQHSTQALVVSKNTQGLVLVGEQGGTGTVIARSANGGTTWTVPLTMTDIGSTEGGDCFSLV